MFFSDFSGIWRTLVVGACAYLMLVVLLRITGKRTLSKMNAFDLVVTVALGSTVSGAFVNRNVDMTQSVLAVGYLILLQFAVSWLTVRSSTFLKVIKSEPSLVLFQGEFIRETMRRERISEPEIAAAIREEGHSKIEEVDAVVLETDGTLTVMRSLDSVEDSAMEYVKMKNVEIHEKQ